MNELTDKEKAMASVMGVLIVNQHSSQSNWPSVLSRVVAICTSREEAYQQIQVMRQSEEDDFRLCPPISLLCAFEQGIIDVTRLREMLQQTDVDYQYKMPPLLTLEEKSKAETVKIYYIWYEDKFHFGGDRDSFPVCICLTKEEAEKETDKLGRSSPSEMDGHDIVGPCNLLIEKRLDVVREVLRRIDSGQSGAIPIPFQVW